MFDVSGSGRIELNPVSWKHVNEHTLTGMLSMIENKVQKECNIDMDLNSCPGTFKKRINETDSVDLKFTITGYPVRYCNGNGFLGLTEYLSENVSEIIQSVFEELGIELNDIPSISFDREVEVTEFEI